MNAPTGSRQRPGPPNDAVSTPDFRAPGFHSTRGDLFPLRGESPGPDVVPCLSVKLETGHGTRLLIKRHPASPKALAFWYSCNVYHNQYLWWVEIGLSRASGC